MDFFDRQERARRTSRFLVVAFALSFLAVVIATTALAALVLRLYVAQVTPFDTTASFGEWAFANSTMLGAIALGTLAVLLLGSGYRTASLAGGGAQVARLFGGSEVAPDTTDHARKRLLNVVEEMAIASGLPVPAVYILEQEEGINAFAAGLTPADAAIAVTRGALERLDRAELQGVIGHEISHILNGDMRLNQRLIGFSFGILLLSLIGRWLLRSARFNRRGRSSGAGPALAIGLGLTVIGSIGLLLSRLIKAAVSRERERLADASAVQFTRDPAGLASALKKIAGFGGRLTAIDSEEVAHMLFENGGRAFRGWFATHPPLVERIQALDPAFDPRHLARRAPAQARDRASSIAAQTPARLAAAGTAALTENGVAPCLSDDSPLEHAGELGSPTLGTELRAALPASIYDAAHSRESSLLLALALAFSPDGAILAVQRRLLEAQLGARRAQRCEALRDELERLDPALRIPLLELALPALRQRPKAQLEFLFELADKLVECGGERQLFDHLLLRMLAAQLGELPGLRRISSQPKMRSTRAACASLIAVVAAYGHDDAEAARAAYRAGSARFGTLPEPTAPLETLRDLALLDAALARLARLGPLDKRKVLEGVLATIRHDKHVGLEELELLRAVAAAFDTPLPWGAGIVGAGPSAAGRAISSLPSAAEGRAG